MHKRRLPEANQDCEARFFFPGTDRWASIEFRRRARGWVLPLSGVEATCNFAFMRRVVKSDKRPLEIKPLEESVWICMCGLSKNKAFSVGSHKTTRDEEDGKTYEYDGEGHGHEV